MRLAEQLQIDYLHKLAVTIHDPKQLPDMAERVQRELVPVGSGGSPQSQIPLSLEDFQKLIQ